MFEITEAGTDLHGVQTAILLTPFLLAAMITDVSSRRVPNSLIIMMFASGILAHTSATANAGDVLLASVGGACIGLLVLLPFYVLGGMGAGDVKLLAAAGSFLGPQLALLAGVFTLGAGAVLGLIVLACRRFGAHLSASRRAAVPPERGAAVQLPYSLAISAGTLLAVMQ